VPNFRGRLIGDLVLKGRAETIRAFEPLRVEQYDSPATSSYLKAIKLLEANDERAIAAFAAHVGTWPDDRLASFHLKRVLNGATGTRIELG
jgi:adenylate cyclase